MILCNVLDCIYNKEKACKHLDPRIVLNLKGTYYCKSQAFNKKISRLEIQMRNVVERLKVFNILLTHECSNDVLRPHYDIAMKRLGRLTERYKRAKND